jgi:hypothetical protein
MSNQRISSLKSIRDLTDASLTTMTLVLVARARARAVTVVVVVLVVYNKRLWRLLQKQHHH